MITTNSSKKIKDKLRNFTGIEGSANQGKKPCQELLLAPNSKYKKLKKESTTSQKSATLYKQA